MQNENNAEETNFEETNADVTTDTNEENTSTDTVDQAGEIGKLRRLLKKEQEKNNKSTEAVAPVATPNQDGLSQTDLIAVMRSDIDDSEMESVMKFAKGTGMTVAEAVKDKTFKSILAGEREEKKTAEVTNAGKQRGGVSEKSIDRIKENASKGKMPEGDDMTKFLKDRYKQN